MSLCILSGCFCTGKGFYSPILYPNYWAIYKIWAMFWNVPSDWISFCFTDGHAWIVPTWRLLSHWTHQDGLYPLDTPGWLVPPGHIRMACTQLDIPGSLGHTWDGHTWKLRTHLEALDTSKVHLSQGISFGPFKTTPLHLHEPCQN